MSDIANADNNDNVHPFIKKLGEEIAAEAPTKYLVSPQQAYAQAGYPRGELMPAGGTCRGCANRALAYSMAGVSEVRISGMCEPCFDFVMVHPDDREKLDQWMTLVTYNKKDT